MLVTRPGEMADALNSWSTSANWKPKLTPNDNIWADSGGSVTAYSRPLPVSQQWQLPRQPAQIVSRLRPGVKLAEHFVHGVDDRLRLIQLNRVT
jgi:hypothetical protein